MLSWKNRHNFGNSEVAYIPPNETTWPYKQLSNAGDSVYRPKSIGEEFSVWKAYVPVLDKEVPMEIDQGETYTNIYQRRNIRWDVYEPENSISDYLVWKALVLDKETMDTGENKSDFPTYQRILRWDAYDPKKNISDYYAWKTYTDKQKLIEIGKDLTYSSRYQYGNNRWTVIKPKYEEFSVWKAHIPVLDEEEPMEIDQEETHSPLYHGIFPKSEEFSAWESHMPVLDKVEPMEIDQNETYLSENHGKSTGYNNHEAENKTIVSLENSPFELGKGESMNSGDMGRISETPIHQYSKEDSSLETKNLMGMNSNGQDYAGCQNGKADLYLEENMQGHDGKYDNHKENLQDFNGGYGYSEVNFQDFKRKHKYQEDTVYDYNTEHECNDEDQGLTDAEFELYLEHLRQETKKRRLEQLKQLTSKINKANT